MNKASENLKLENFSDYTQIIIHNVEQSGSPIVTGCPFPAASIPENCNGAKIFFSNGDTVDAQVTELTPETPDGIKWLELSFIGTCKGLAGVKLTAPGENKVDDLGVQENQDLLLNNSLLQVALNKKGNKPPISIQWSGGTGTLSTEIMVNGNSAKEIQNSKRSLRILRNGPVRCRAECSGQLFTDDGKPSFSYRIIVEIWKAISALRIDWMLSHELPGVMDVDVSSAGLLGDWQLGKGNTERVFLQPRYTAEYKTRIVRNPQPVSIIVDETGAAPHVQEYEMLMDDSSYPFYCQPAVENVPPWLQLHGVAGAVCATVKDFQETRPNALQSSGNRLDYFMVPDNKVLRWPQGRRKQQNILFSFSDGDEDLKPRNLVSLAKSMYAQGHALPAPETLIHEKCFDLDRALNFEPGQNLRLNNLLDSFCRDLKTPHEKWDIGDTSDLNYTLIYGAGPNQYFPLSGVQAPHKRFGRGLFPESTAVFIEPVWTNNEYDMIHALATEVMRTGKTDHFNMLHWAARHNIEIDFIVYSDDIRHNQASPFHSHFHNTKGAVTSHFWTQGLMEYYCLSGDDDALDTALALGNKIIEITHSGVTANWKFDREIGWALLALVSLMDSGYGQFREEAEEIVTFLRDYDRKNFQGAVRLTGSREGLSLERQMIDCGFGYTSMVEALDKYQRLTKCEDMQKWMFDLLNDLKDALWSKVEDGEIPTVHNMIGMMMAIGFERTGNTDFLLGGELALEHYLDPAFPIKHPRGAENGQSKPCAMSYRALFRLLGAMQKTGRIGQYEYPAIMERINKHSSSSQKDKQK